MLIKPALIKILFGLLLFGFLSCGSEPKDGATTEASTEISVDDLLMEEDISDAPSSQDTSAVNLEENVPPPPVMTEKEKVIAEKVKVKRKEIVKEQLADSPFKNCEETIAKYTELVEAYLQGNNRWKEWDSNDPIFNACKKKADYKAKVEALDAKMDAFDEEDE